MQRSQFFHKILLRATEENPNIFFKSKNSSNCGLKSFSSLKKQLRIVIELLDPQIVFLKYSKIICDQIIFVRKSRKMFEIDVASFPAEYTLNELEFFLAT